MDVCNTHQTGETSRQSITVLGTTPSRPRVRRGVLGRLASMCGIIGVVGAADTLDIILEGLSRLEYRGYDSAGVALAGAGETWRARTADGTESVSALVKACEDAPRNYQAGLGHTRWATHGAPEADNAHPHFDCSGTVALIHNGIIENHRELRAELEARGHSFTSVTDSEVVAHLVGMNLVFAALLADQRPPERGVDLDEFISRLGDEIASHGSPERRRGT